ncbi:MAG: TonB-dependent receptor [Bacteroidetes bacterium]|nr:TonB-dependent receptor [Bacteroidota bacterium]
MRKIIPLAILLFIFVKSHAQFANISGRVIAKADQSSLPGVSVIIDDNSGGTTTDINGNYTLQVAAGSHTITYRMIGMKERKEKVTLQQDENKILIIMLEDDSKELGVVVVSASKFEQKLEEVTVSMNVIRPSIVESKNITSMDDMLDQSPSVSIIDGQANIRGGSGWSYGAGSRVLILVDDLPQLTSDAGDAKWSFLPVENLEQIEIIKGASSVLYGSSAMNGVINVRTAYPKSTPQTRISVYSGFYDTNQKMTLSDTTYNLNQSGSISQKISGVNFLHSRQINNLDVVVGGHMLIDEGYRQGEYEDRARINFNLRYRFKKIDGLSVGLNFNTQLANGTTFFIWQNDTTGAYLPAGGTGEGTSLSGYITHRTNVDPYITYVTKGGSTHKIRTRFFRTNNENTTNQESIADFYYGEYQYQKRFSDVLSLSGGIVATSSKVKSELYRDHSGSSFAGYLQADAKFFHKLILSAGGRIEQNKLDSATDKLVPVFRAGMNYKLFEHTNLRASYGQGYRYPSVAEKYIRTQVSGLDIYPNDSLESEKGFSAEVGIMQGLRLGGWKGYLDVAAFYTEYKNMIEFTYSVWDKAPIPPSYGIGFKALNIGNTRIKGFDVTLIGEGNFGKLLVSTSAGYTYLIPEVTYYDSAYIIAQYAIDKTAYLGSDSSNYLKYRSSHLFKGDIAFGYGKFSLGVSARYNSFMKNIDKLFVNYPLGDFITPGVRHYRNSRTKGDLIFDARLSSQLTANVKFAVIVKNVFNYIYMQRPTDMQPPRVFSGQLTISF